MNEDILTMRGVLNRLKMARKPLLSMRTSGTRENTAIVNLLDYLTESIYWAEDLMNNLSESAHWDTIMTFQKEVHRL